MPKKGIAARVKARVVNSVTPVPVRAPQPPTPPAPPVAPPPPPPPPPRSAAELLDEQLRADHPELVPVTVGKQTYLAHPLTDVSSYADLVQQNLDLVTSVAVAADIRAALISQNDPGRTVVAIRIEDRDVFVKHLVEVLGTEAVYVSPMPPNRRPQPVPAQAVLTDASPLVEAIPTEAGPTEATPTDDAAPAIDADLGTDPSRPTDPSLLLDPPLPTDPPLTSEATVPVEPAAKPSVKPPKAPPKIKSTPILAGLVTPDNWPGAELSSVLKVFRVWAGPQGRRVIAGTAACEIEWWENDHFGLRRPPRGNRLVSELHDWPPDAAETTPTDAIPPLVKHPKRLDVDLQFPIDLVYTWVDGSDPRLQAERLRYSDPDAVPDAHQSALAAARWRNRDELRYSLRSVQTFANWIRHIWIVTADQVPPWLDQSDPRITVVSHRDIFADPSVLPTFNSHAIESQLHHIAGLAEHYLYANDDVFFGRPMRPEHFFLSNGLARIFRSSSKIDIGAWQPGDRPLLAAHKRLRDMLERDFGVTISNRLKHTVFPQTRSVLAELEERYQDDFTRTAASRFRSPSDLSVASALVPNYLFLTGRAYPAPLSYGYVNSGHADLGEVLQAWLANGTLESFCINDEGITSDVMTEDEQHRLITEFLAEYFPWPSSFEQGSHHDE